MSLYPQSAAYGQMPPYPGYGLPMLPSTGYQYPPPAQPVYHVDPNTFRRDYMSRLSTLTINSRPIIQSLSMLAQEYSRFAEVAAQCIESHIRRVPPWMKLPAFYLLDAISKNVFDPYAHQFTPMVVRLFLDTYEQVDQSTRSKMEEMLLTWRTGAPNGRELFGIVPQVAIERQIWGADTTQNVASTSRHPATSASISTAQVLSELEFVLGQKERAMQADPYDKVSQNHVGILHQLRKLVQAGVSQEELGQILNQLRTLAIPAAPVPQQLPSPPSLLPYQNQQIYPSPASQASYSAPVNPPSFPPQLPYPIAQPDIAKPEPVDYSSVSPSQPPPAAPVVPSVSNIASLYSALLKAGMVSATGTPTGAGATAKAEETSMLADPAKEAARQYRKAILGTKIKLTSADITRQRPRVISFLYDKLPVQCKQCGIRFTDTAQGKKMMEDHLDMHFRQNRKASQAVGRGHSRSWFVSVEDWVHDGVVDIKGKGRADGPRLVNSSAAAAADAAKREAELRALYVVVPSGDEAKSISCPICKEPLKSEFLEDDEEWVWRNAVKKDDRIYHATCHAEATTSKTHLVARLRNEASSRSRSRTPEKASARATPAKPSVTLPAERKSSPPSSGGTKRKADDFDATSASQGARDAPPLKKLAV